jgi:branched-chain amino acid transport system substrate-binding protein
VVWASSTPPNDPSVAEALADCCGSDWDGKLLINAEFDLLDSGEPDAELMLQLHEEAGADFPVSSFAQMGFLNAKVATEALLRMGEGADYTVESVNDAFYTLTNMESDMWCRPWYYSSGADLANVSNNTDRTVVPQGGVMVETEDCFDILATPDNALGAIREFEVGQGWR